MRVLVTGGAGFVGRFLVRKLVQDGHDVVVLDNLSTGHADTLPPQVRLIVGDVTDDNAVAVALEGVSAVVHLAALLIVEESFAKPDAYHDAARIPRWIWWALPALLVLWWFVGAWLFLRD